MSAYVCVGFCAVEVLPSPKSQLHEIMLPNVVVEESKKLVMSPIHPSPVLKMAVTDGSGGGGVTLIVNVSAQ